MAARTNEAHADRLDQVLALVREKVPAEARGPVEAFVRAYYRQVDPEDLAERTPADLYGAALSHWNFARRRAPGQARVRVFNPSVQEHGWESTHTIVEIVNDDMPFLVSSVTMEVNRHGLTLHLIVHPTMRVNRQGAEHALMGVLPDDSPSGSRESFMHIEVDRITDPARMEVLAVGSRARPRRRPHRGRGLEEDARQGARDRRRPRAPAAADPAGWTSPRRGRSSRGSPTTTSRSSATATTTWS